MLGKDFERVRPPIPGVHAARRDDGGEGRPVAADHRFRSAGNFIYSGRLLLRYLADSCAIRRGTRIVMGNAMVARLFYSLKKYSVPVLFESSVTEAVSEGGRVTGVVVSPIAGHCGSAREEGW